MGEWKSARECDQQTSQQSYEVNKSQVKTLGRTSMRQIMVKIGQHKLRLEAGRSRAREYLFQI